MMRGAAHAAGRGVRVSGKEAILLGSSLLVIGVLHVVMLRAGHGWSDDFAMYLAHAINLLEGRPYGATGYVANPWAVPGPATYPPVYPLLIVPLIALWGPDLHLLKLFDVAMLCGALATAYALVRSRVGAKVALAGVALLGLCPFLIDFGDEVRPDALFLLLFLLTLVLGERWTGVARPFDKGAVLRGLALGGVTYLAYGTRSVGMVLLPALAFTEGWRLRRIGPVLAVAVPVWLLLAVMQSLTLHSDGGYAKLVTLDPHTLVYNTYSYLVSLSLLWGNGWPAPWGFGMRAALFLVTSALAAVGYVRSVRHKVTVLEVIPIFYMAPLIVYWVGTMIQQRYMLPLFPIYLCHAWVGLTALGRRVGEVNRRWLLAALGAVALVGYASDYATRPHGPIEPGVTDADGVTALSYVRDKTPANAVLLVGRARAFALYGRRRTVSPYGFRSDDALWQLIREQRITHVVEGRGPLAKEMDYEHPADIARFVTAHPDLVRSVFRNPAFEIYAVGPAPAGALSP